MTLTNVAFIVPGEPQGKGRPRAGMKFIKGGGKVASLRTPDKTVAYESLVRYAAAHAMGEELPLEGPLAVEIDAVHAVPASWSKKRAKEAMEGQTRPTVKPDIDNIAKAINDGGNGVVWIDDKQIVVQTVRKLYGWKGQVMVRVAKLERS